MDERVLVWAPLRDARLTCGFLAEGAYSCLHCRTWEELREELDRGAGVLVVAGEFLTESVVPNLEAVIEAQPAWSDLPVIVVAGTGPMPGEDRVARLGNVSLLQRPLAVDTLRSTVRAALRARRRQYQIRDLLRQRDEADRRKDEFLAMLAHELRNPLAPLRTGLELLKHGPSPPVVERAKATMQRQIVNLTRLVDDLLDVSRITRRKIALQTTLMDARQAIQDSAANAQSLAAAKGLDIHVHAPERPVPIEADPVRLEQMAGNLIGNAIKFTPAGGAIHVSVEAVQDWAVIRVRDTGVGISPGALPRVFDLFEQASPSLDRSYGGLGIGLTVVRLVAELHGGRAQIFSAGPGTGTEAVVHLPLCPHPRPAGAAAQPESLARGPARRVLLIEDNPDVADMLAEYLQLAGHDVIQAHDGPTGLAAAVRYRPAVIVCDIGLPGLDGYEVARRLRQRSAFRSCLLIAVSGYGEPADREKARTAGFTHHITKPADPAALAELIATEG